MQKIFLIILVLTFCSCIPKKKESEENNTEKVNEVPGITKIEFNEDFHDLGNLKSGEIVVYSFIFKNIGEHNLIIEKLKSDCGCLEASSSKKSIKPGSTGSIEVEFDTSGLFGKQFKSIEIHANTKELKHLAIFAEVENEHLEIKY